MLCDNNRLSKIDEESNMHEWKNKWISTPEFIKLKPLNMLYKEENRVFPDLPAELKKHHTLYR